ncbi:MBOAT family O-acyltransferase [Marinicella litoralis]|uniref:Probable alginate O-acetylase n=1 Tax=Marinicella litoralis TaxID=644220 RepID=A0A4R6XC92_9GAMM|nr:MBOAT family O-acyltransferase [Marinicella litoralis]TDR16872.1 D-alanyl-lipoteichoic acid acyltransferase DltB (MBOAT superfamily) [Marinicella litoralis]
MLFNSLTFLLFFAWVVAVHYSSLRWSLKKGHLLLASYAFYAAWNPPFVLLLWLSTLVDWQVAKQMDQQTVQKKRKHWLWLSLSINLGMLVVFKYADFLLANFQMLLTLLGLNMTFADPGLILPMGISFFTFQTLSYTLDVYYKRLKPWHGFWDYALFVSFFPQLVAGPIVRAKSFLPQLLKQTRVDINQFSIGLSFFIIGLFQKMVMADSFFAPIVNQVFSQHETIDTTSSWLGSLFFSAQIFCDFSGYSLCAIGLAMCLGFVLPINFRSPFAAMGFSDFWRRWHISLSSWLRDYLYIPLGGNRNGQFKRYRNLLLTMLLGGLWHGAAWTFVIWGALHGSYLVLEQLIKQSRLAKRFKPNAVIKLILAVLTFLAVVLAFVVFRSENLSQAGHIIAAMFGISGSSNVTTYAVKQDAWLLLVVVAFVLMMASQWFMRNKSLSEVIAHSHAVVRALFIAAALLFIMLSTGNSNAFIYFQF